ncbi:MAG: HlyD family secretion protein, partial [Halothiobacillaceae bacterium]
MDNTQSTMITTLGLDPITLRQQRRRRWWWWVLLLLLIGLGIALWRATPPAPTLSYKTAPAHRGDLVVTVTATGNLRPTNVVDVGIEVSGTVAKVAVDFNDTVKRGELLAQLDTTKLATAVLKSQAALASAQAQVDQVQATVIETQATLNRLERMRKLTDGKLPTEQELIGAQAAQRRAIAEEANAKAAVIQAQATLDGNLTDLTKATIRSPINGDVLKRAVEPGQTVAASFQAPILFTLAE